jgi:hypothetical protein
MVEAQGRFNAGHQSGRGTGMADQMFGGAQGNRLVTAAEQLKQGFCLPGIL